MTAYKQFAGAVRAGDSAMVWRMMSPSAQRTARGKLGLAGNASEADVLATLVARPGWGFEIDRGHWAKIDQAQSSDTRRLVTVFFNGKPRLIPVVKINGGWRVDLFSSKVAPAT